MPCECFVGSDGSVMMICSRGRKSVTPCFYCGKPMTSLCDYPKGQGKTCDRAMCNQCKTKIGPVLDVCREHNNPGDILKTQHGGAL